MRISTLRNAHGQPWAQLVEAGDLFAVREGDCPAGDVTLDGCPGFDAYLGLIGELPSTVGIVRRVRVVQDLYDRGTDQWIRRPGAVRLIDVPDAGPEHLVDDPSLVEPIPPEGEPAPATLRLLLLSPAQYFRMFRERLPTEQWQARGFLVDLDVAGPA